MPDSGQNGRQQFRLSTEVSQLDPIQQFVRTFADQVDDGLQDVHGGRDLLQTVVNRFKRQWRATSCRLAGAGNTSGSKIISLAEDRQMSIRWITQEKMVRA